MSGMSSDRLSIFRAIQRQHAEAINEITASVRALALPDKWCDLPDGTTAERVAADVVEAYKAQLLATFLKLHLGDVATTRDIEGVGAKILDALKDLRGCAIVANHAGLRREGN